MLTFEQKVAILSSFPELERKDVSMGRVNFHFEGSVFDKKSVGYHFHKNGNGFVFAGRLQDIDSDERGYVNVRDYGEQELRELVARSIESLSGDSDAWIEPEEGQEETWEGPNRSVLTIRYEDDMWYVFAGLNLDGAFETYEEAKAYLIEEGFVKR
ncbi:MAG: hypothetical protein J7559_12380 [Cohnella sp.]|nr:hypothetical protein [Cohnella sp.]